MKCTQKKRETNRHADMHVLGNYCYISKGMVLYSHEDSDDEEFKKVDLIPKEIHRLCLWCDSAFYTDSN